MPNNTPDNVRKLTERFNNSLSRLSNSRLSLEMQLERVFDALQNKGVSVSIDTDQLMRELQTSEVRAYENSKTVTRLLHQSFELTRTSALISSKSDLPEIIDEVMDTIVRLTGAERAYLMLQDSMTGKMTIVAARNWERESLPDDDVVFSQHIVQLAVEKQAPIISADAVADMRFKNATSVFAKGMRSVLCIPLILRGKVIGIFYADNPLQRGVFKEDDLPILVAFAHQTAITIENARLYHELERRNRQLDEANRLKAEFLGVISHELKTPFAPLGMALESFPRYGMDALSPEQRELWDDLTDGVQHTRNLVYNLVNYANLLSKQGRLRMDRVDMTKLLCEAVDDAGRMANTRQLTLEAEIPEQLFLPAGDEERLSDAIWHLLQNAIQYNQPGGKITLRASVPDADTLCIEVEDTGKGIPPEHQERIWEAFEQLGDSLKRGVEGLGLGLALVRYVAVSHGGGVTLESVPGEGSTFGLELPLSAAPRADSRWW